MPVYNGALFIKAALDSLLAQSFTDFELIISDNASNDDTEEICMEYAKFDKRIRYVRQPVNRGAVANFQFVLDKAVGEYFMWAAADDSQTPDFIELLVYALDKNPEFVCVMSDVNNIVESTNYNGFISTLDDIRIDDIKVKWPKCRRRFFRNPSSNIFFCIYGLFKAEIIKSVELNYRGLQKYMFSSEIPLLAQVALRGQIASISSPAKIYLRHSQSSYHQEKKIIKTKDKFFGFFTVSLSLLLIAIRSNLSFFQKLTIMGTTVATSFKWLVLFLLRLIYSSLRNVIVGS